MYIYIWYQVNGKCTRFENTKPDSLHNRFGVVREHNGSEMRWFVHITWPGGATGAALMFVSSNLYDLLDLFFSR